MQRLRLTSRIHPAPERGGAATVETALVLPIFFMVMLGIVEIGRFFMVTQLMTNAAREGARIAIMTGSTNADVTSTVQQIAQQTANVAPANLTVTITITPYPGNPNPANNLANATKRDMVSVVASVPYNKVNLMPVKWLTGVNVVGQAAMRHE